MIEYVYRETEGRDITALSKNMRSYDRDEVYAASGSTPYEALRSSHDRSIEAFTGLADDVPFMIFGVAPVSTLTSIGTPWLLCSENIWDHRRELIRVSAPVTRSWLDNTFSVLINYIDARHKPGLRWARHTGFTILPAIPFGLFDMPFHPIIMRGTHV